jgi:hypothetical protein
MTAAIVKNVTSVQDVVELWDQDGIESMDQRLDLLEEALGVDLENDQRVAALAYMEAMRKPLGSDANGVVPPGMPPGAGLVCEWDEVARFAMGALLGFGNIFG